jgi:hypothetical protein
MRSGIDGTHRSRRHRDSDPRTRDARTTLSVADAAGNRSVVKLALRLRR